METELEETEDLHETSAPMRPLTEVLGEAANRLQNPNSEPENIPYAAKLEALRLCLMPYGKYDPNPQVVYGWEDVQFEIRKGSDLNEIIHQAFWAGGDAKLKEIKDAADLLRAGGIL